MMCSVWNSISAILHFGLVSPASLIIRPMPMHTKRPPARRSLQTPTARSPLWSPEWEPAAPSPGQPAFCAVTCLICKSSLLNLMKAPFFPGERRRPINFRASAPTSFPQCWTPDFLTESFPSAPPMPEGPPVKPPQKRGFSSVFPAAPPSLRHWNLPKNRPLRANVSW